MGCSGFGLGSPVSMTETGQFGDYIGGVVGTIFSGAAFWLLYKTLEQQNKTNIREGFDDMFTKMLQINQENLKNMIFDASKLIADIDGLYIEPRIYKGKDVFQLFFLQFITCKNELSSILSKTDKIYTQEYLQFVKSLPLIKNRNIDIYQLARIDICYSIVFFGVGSEGIAVLRSIFKDRYKDTIIDKVLNYLSLKPANDLGVNLRWNKLNSFSSSRNTMEHIRDIYEWRKNQTHKGYSPEYPGLSEGYRSDFVKYYSGFHQLLGHYFRHLYQLVTMVDESNIVSEEEKQRFVKMVRNQMSNYEQMVLFLNSLSYMGRSWELDSTKNKKKLSHKQLISHYGLIKNIPIGGMFGIKAQKYYPNINYELFK